MATSGQYICYIPLPPVPWSDTKTFQVLCSDIDTSIPIENLSFHQAESFIAQNGKDRVRLRDFVVFCQHTNSYLELQPLVSNMFQRIDSTLTQEIALTSCLLAV